MVLKKNQPGYVQAKDKNGKTYWKKTDTTKPQTCVEPGAAAESDFAGMQQRDPEGDKKAFDYLLREKDFDNIASTISEQDTPEDVQYTYDNLKFAASRRGVGYIDAGEKIIEAFVDNDETPDKVLSDLVKVGNTFHDTFNGIHKDLMESIASHPNASEETQNYIDERMQRFADDIDYNSEAIDKMRGTIRKAEAAFKSDPELEGRLRNVYVMRPKGGRSNERVMHFDPKDVEAVGEEYIMKNYVRLFGATYNPESGRVHGYTN